MWRNSDKGCSAGQAYHGSAGAPAAGAGASPADRSDFSLRTAQSAVAATCAANTTRFGRIIRLWPCLPGCPTLQMTVASRNRLHSHSGSRMTQLRPRFITFDCYGTLTRFQMGEMAREIYADRIPFFLKDQSVTDFYTFLFVGNVGMA